jgi:hypothetical protein
MMYPVPFATVDDVVRLAVEAEQLGYYDVAGKDHLSTQAYVREAWRTPPFLNEMVRVDSVAPPTPCLSRSQSVTWGSDD